MRDFAASARASSSAAGKMPPPPTPVAAPQAPRPPPKRPPPGETVAPRSCAGPAGSLLGSERFEDTAAREREELAREGWWAPRALPESGRRAGGPVAVVGRLGGVGGGGAASRSESIESVETTLVSPKDPRPRRFRGGRSPEREVASMSPRKIVAPRSPDLVAMQILQSMAKELEDAEPLSGPETRRSRSPEKKAAPPKSPEKGIAPQSPKKDTAHKSPKKDVPPKSPKKMPVDISKSLAEDPPADIQHQCHETRRSRSPEKRVTASNNLEAYSAPGGPAKSSHFPGPKKQQSQLHPMSTTKAVAAPHPKSPERAASPRRPKNPEKLASPRRPKALDLTAVASRLPQRPGNNVIRPLTLPNSPTLGRQVATKVTFGEPAEPVRAESSSVAFSSSILPGLQASQTGALTRSSIVTGPTANFPAPASSVQPPEPSKAASGVFSSPFRRAEDNAPDAERCQEDPATRYPLFEKKSLPRHLSPSVVREILKGNMDIAQELAKTNPNIIKAELFDHDTCPPADPALAFGFRLPEPDRMPRRETPPATSHKPGRTGDVPLRRHPPRAGRQRRRGRAGPPLRRRPIPARAPRRRPGPRDRRLRGAGAGAARRAAAAAAASRARRRRTAARCWSASPTRWRPRPPAAAMRSACRRTACGSARRAGRDAARRPLRRRGAGRAARAPGPDGGVQPGSGAAAREAPSRGAAAALLPERERATVSVVTLAAHQWQGTPAERDPAWYYAPSEEERLRDGGVASFLRNQLRLILRVAAKHNHSRLLLGDFGGVGGGCPSILLARAFLQVAREEEFGGARWEHVSFNVPERYAIRDKEGNDYFDAGEDVVPDPELTIARMGKDQFKTLQIYLDFQLL